MATPAKPRDRKPAASTVPDFDALTNRAERRAKTRKIKIGGKVFTHPDAIPLGVITALGELQEGRLAALSDIMVLLFGDQATEPEIADLTVDDLTALVGIMWEGANLGNSEASPASS